MWHFHALSSTDENRPLRRHSQEPYVSYLRHARTHAAVTPYRLSIIDLIQEGSARLEVGNLPLLEHDGRTREDCKPTIVGTCGDQPWLQVTKLGIKSRLVYPEEIVDFLEALLLLFGKAFIFKGTCQTRLDGL